MQKNRAHKIYFPSVWLQQQQKRLMGCTVSVLYSENRAHRTCSRVPSAERRRVTVYCRKWRHSRFGQQGMKLDVPLMLAWQFHVAASTTKENDRSPFPQTLTIWTADFGWCQKEQNLFLISHALLSAFPTLSFSGLTISCSQNGKLHSVAAKRDAWPRVWGKWMGS